MTDLSTTTATIHNNLNILSNYCYLNVGGTNNNLNSCLVSKLWIVVILFDVLVPKTCSKQFIVVVLSNAVVPEIFSEDIHVPVILYVVLVYITPIKTAGNVAEPSVDVWSFCGIYWNSWVCCNLHLFCTVSYK